MAKGIPGGWYTGEDGEAHHALDPPAPGWWLGKDSRWYPPRPPKVKSPFGGLDRLDLLGPVSWFNALSGGKQAVIIVAAVALFVGVLALGALNKETPIDQQNCSQLADTYAQIDSDIRDNNDVGQAMQDAAELNDRIDSLGGCPSEPSLQ